jgi:hypothetical protein
MYVLILYLQEHTAMYNAAVDVWDTLILGCESGIGEKEKIKVSVCLSACMYV